MPIPTVPIKGAILPKHKCTTQQYNFNSSFQARSHTVSPDNLALYRMAEHRVPSQQANPILADAHPHPALHQVQGHLRHVAFLIVSFTYVYRALEPPWSRW